MFIRKLSGRPPSRKRPEDHPAPEVDLAASWKVAHQRPEEQLDGDFMFIRNLSGRPPSRKRPGNHPLPEPGLAASWKMAQMARHEDSC